MLMPQFPFFRGTFWVNASKWDQKICRFVAWQVRRLELRAVASSVGVRTDLKAPGHLTNIHSLQSLQVCFWCLPNMGPLSSRVARTCIWPGTCVAPRLASNVPWYHFSAKGFTAENLFRWVDPCSTAFPKNFCEKMMTFLSELYMYCTCGKEMVSCPLVPWDVLLTIHSNILLWISDRNKIQNKRWILWQAREQHELGTSLSKHVTCGKEGALQCWHAWSS
jgi:hypothetical protein